MGLLVKCAPVFLWACCSFALDGRAANLSSSSSSGVALVQKRARQHTIHNSSYPDHGQGCLNSDGMSIYKCRDIATTHGGCWSDYNRNWKDSLGRSHFNTCCLCGGGKRFNCECPHGFRKDPQYCSKPGQENCKSCHFGYVEMHVLHTLQCREKKCVCTNGVPTKGDSCYSDGASSCASCAAGYHKVPSSFSKIDECEINECACVNGVAATGPSCRQHGSNACSSCHHGYIKVGTSCQSCSDNTQGCGWTEWWRCPDQPPGNKTQGVAGADGSLGYECCCNKQRWMDVPTFLSRPNACQWTDMWNCPGQKAGSHGASTWDDSMGYEACCEKEGWKVGCWDKLVSDQNPYPPQACAAWKNSTSGALQGNRTFAEACDDQWALENCAATCGKCANATVAKSPAPTVAPSLAPTVVPSPPPPTMPPSKGIACTATQLAKGQGITDSKCTDACKLLPDARWPCGENDLCACS
eukprot:TRINITY_DN19247_c0_g1_i1.p1 TRINITY_DN19247_c0_g1~~TRINITY_DN19247_c0_g1_i1.p1  ORF type:complete len:468 (+),score=39.42 TRINITY_DN19247_c0_g1_i1:65-1468(+)